MGKCTTKTKVRASLRRYHMTRRSPYLLRDQWIVNNDRKSTPCQPASGTSPETCPVGSMSRSASDSTNRALSKAVREASAAAPKEGGSAKKRRMPLSPNTVNESPTTIRTTSTSILTRPFAVSMLLQDVGELALDGEYLFLPSDEGVEDMGVEMFGAPFL